MLCLSAGPLLAMALLGFLAGLLSFKVAARWCLECGEALGCVACRDQARVKYRTER